VIITGPFESSVLRCDVIRMAISPQRIIRYTPRLVVDARVFGVGGSNGAISSWTKFNRNAVENCARNNYIGHNLKRFLSNETNVARSLSNSRASCFSKTCPVRRSYWVILMLNGRLCCLKWYDDARTWAELGRLHEAGDHNHLHSAVTRCFNVIDKGLLYPGYVFSSASLNLTHDSLDRQTRPAAAAWTTWLC